MKTDEQSWTIVSCRCNRADEDSCTWFFFQNGALGLEVENLDQETTRIKASFAANNFSAENLLEINRQFKQAQLDDAARSLSVETIADQNWMSNWKKYFEPFTIGDSFFICPPWRADEIKNSDFAGRQKILIDPGMAFGTGQHATTSFCLQAIKRWAKGPQILDVGTGSGILAIACALSIPKSCVLALDIDINAIHNAEENIELNNVSKQIELKQMSPEMLCVDTGANRQFNTLLANITVEDIVSLLPTFNSLLANDGILILAGIIEERSHILESALAEYPLKRLDKSIDRGWAGMVLARGDFALGSR